MSSTNTHLLSQHVGSKGRMTVSSKTAWLHHKTLSQKKIKKKPFLLYRFGTILCLTCPNFFFCYCFETGSYYVAQVGLELTILLPHSLECWDHRHVPPCLAGTLFLEVCSGDQGSLSRSETDLGRDLLVLVHFTLLPWH
jgi:hypothetical protein